VPGLVSYTMLRTDDGGISVTVCQDKAGTDESVRLAADYLPFPDESTKVVMTNPTQSPFLKLSIKPDPAVTEVE